MPNGNLRGEDKRKFRVKTEFGRNITKLMRIPLDKGDWKGKDISIKRCEVASLHEKLV